MERRGFLGVLAAALIARKLPAPEPVQDYDYQVTATEILERRLQFYDQYGRGWSTNNLKATQEQLMEMWAETNEVLENMLWEEGHGR